MKQILFGLILIIGLLGCSKEVSNAVKAQHLQAELVSEVKTIRPGEPFWVGLRLDMEEGWHVNWLNPGDAGLAPKITWQLPDGFNASEIEWPWPIKIPVSPFMLFGYGGNVLLPVKITPPTELKSGDVKLIARAEWVVCSDACIPGKATLNLELEAKDEEPEINENWAAKFDAVRKKLPANDEEWLFDAEISPNRIYIKMSPLGDSGPAFQHMFFFPEEQGIINNATDQVLTKKGNGYELEIERDRMSTQIPTELTGVLVVDKSMPEGKERKGIKLNLTLKIIES